MYYWLCRVWGGLALHYHNGQCTIIYAIVGEMEDNFFESRLESIDTIDQFRSSILMKKVSFKKVADPRETQSV